MLVAHLTFSVEDEDETGDGWVLTLGSDINSINTTTKHPTITAATAAMAAAFAADDGVVGYFTQVAQQTVLDANAAAVATETTSLLTAEGL